MPEALQKRNREDERQVVKFLNSLGRFALFVQQIRSPLTAVDAPKLWTYFGAMRARRTAAASVRTEAMVLVLASVGDTDRAKSIALEKNRKFRTISDTTERRGDCGGLEQGRQPCMQPDR
jgi:hypothetical protein